MKKNLIVISIGLFLGLCALAPVSAQTLSTVAVFDLNQVMLSFYSDSDIIRDYNAALDEYRSDILVAEDELRDLQARRATAVSRNNSREAARLRDEISAQQEFIAALDERWYQTEDELLAELDDDVFFQTLNRVAQFVAEENGYTFIVDITRSDLGVFWYSREIDITEDIIEELYREFR